MLTNQMVKKQQNHIILCDTTFYHSRNANRVITDPQYEIY